jgi:hypothetical protein
MFNYIKRLFTPIDEAQKHCQDICEHKKNVVGTGIGENGVVVLVTKKEPKEALSKYDLVPSSVDGYETDVIEVGEVFPAIANRNKHRPVIGGISCMAKGGTACTLGGIVYKGEKPYLLQNAHCGMQFPIGTEVMQPSPMDGGTESIGKIAERVEIKETGNEIDAMIGELSAEHQDLMQAQLGKVSPIPAQVKAGDILRKSGRTTGFTHMKVIATNLTINVNFRTFFARFTGQIMTQGTNAVQGGDSGSLSFNATNQPVGLIFAASPEYQFHNPIQKVLDHFGVSFEPQEEWKFRYFSPNERNVAGLKHELLEKLDEARHIAGIPFVLNSGLRTPEQNKQAGGSPNSAHLTGEAVDIRCRNSAERHKIVTALYQVGFKRVGVAETFVHADISETLPQEVMWLYG